MGLPRLLHPETITALIATTGAPDGDGVPAVTTVPLEIPGCNVQPQSTSELRDNSLEVATSYRVSAPVTGTGITPGTVIEWRLTSPGSTWRVEGDAQEFTGTGYLDHTEFTITRHRG